MNEKGSVIIIGGGIAGLTAGIYAQLHGLSTQIFEMHSVTGGQCTAWNRQGYQFDYCLNWLAGTQRSCIHEIWKTTHVLSEDVQVVYSDILSRVEDEQYGQFIVYTDIDRWEAYLTEMAPEDGRSIRSMCETMRSFSTLEPLRDAPGCRSFDTLIPAMGKMWKLAWPMLRYSSISARDYLDGLHLKNLRLRYFLYRLYGESNNAAIVFLLMLGIYRNDNAGYLAGGSLALAQRMTKRYLDVGGKVQLGAKVKKIIVWQGKAIGVRLHDDTEHFADHIVSAADGYSTLYSMLEGRYVPRVLKEAYREWALFRPFVQVSIGVGKLIASDSTMKYFLCRPTMIGKTLIDKFYVIDQSGQDASLAPAGCTTLVMRFDSAWEIWESMDASAYRREKEQIWKDALTLLEQRYPGISKHIDVYDISTPITGNRFTGVWKGAYEGFMPAPHVVRKSMPPTLPGLKNFYMAGQWTTPGGWAATLCAHWRLGCSAHM